MNKISTFFSFDLISSQAFSTFLSREISVSTNSNLASGFDVESSDNRDAAAVFERPRIYTVGAELPAQNAFKVPIPIPLVAPTNTATRPDASGEDLKVALEVRTDLMDTILAVEMLMWL